MVVWVHVLYVIWCVVLCEIISVVIMALWLCVYDVRDMIWWSQIDIYMIYTCVMISGLMLMYLDVVLSVLRDWNLYVVLNTTCSCIWCYVMCIVVLYYVVMCVYVDNYVDNSLIYVDNFLLHLQHFYELFENIVFSHVFAHHLLLSLVYSYYLFFSSYCHN